MSEAAGTSSSRGEAWRERIAGMKVAISTRPMGLRIAVAGMAGLALLAVQAGMYRGLRAITGFIITLFHFYFGTTTPEEANLDFLELVKSELAFAGIALVAAFVVACIAGIAWNVGQQEFRARFAKLLRREVVLAHLMLVAAAMVLAGLFYSYQQNAEIEWLRVHVCIAAIVAGVGSTICLAGAMHYLDVVRAATRSGEWFVRWPLSIYKRFFLLAEFATMAIAVYAAGVLIFGLKIPGVAQPRL